MTRPLGTPPPIKPAAASEPTPVRTFVNVLVLEAVILVLLWLFGRAYS